MHNALLSREERCALRRAGSLGGYRRRRLYLLVGWLARGGIRRQPTKVTRYPVTMFVSHPVLALTGLGLWIRYLAGGGIT